MRVFRPLVALGLLSSAPAFASGPDPVLLDRVVAVVENTRIYRSEVLERARPILAQRPPGGGAKADAVQREMLDVMIGEILVAVEMTKAHVTVTDDEIDQGIAQVSKQNNLADDQIKAEVAKIGLSWPLYREIVRNQIFEGKWIQLRIRAALPKPDPKLGPVDAEKAMVATVEAARKEGHAKLRANAHVEVRW